MAKKFLSYDGLLFLIQRLKLMFATKAQGDKADTSVQTIKLGDTVQTKTDGVVSLPAYPTSLPANDVPDWAKQSTKPSYSATEVGALPVSTVIPAKVSELQNDSNFTTNAEVNSMISTAVGEISELEFVKLNEGEYNADTFVPTITGSSSKIYLTPNGGSSPNIFDEWIWISSTDTFEKIGTTAVDLSGYLLASDVVPITNDEITSLT